MNDLTVNAKLVRRPPPTGTTETKELKKGGGVVTLDHASRLNWGLGRGSDQPATLTHRISKMPQLELVPKFFSLLSVSPLKGVHLSGTMNLIVPLFPSSRCAHPSTHWKASDIKKLPYHSSKCGLASFHVFPPFRGPSQKQKELCWV